MSRTTALAALDFTTATEPVRSSADSAPLVGSGRLSRGDLDEVIFLRLPEVKMVTGLSKSSLYALIRANSFPAPIRLGPRTVAWLRSEVNQWAVERVLTSRSGASHPGCKRMPQRALGETWTTSKKWA